MNTTALEVYINEVDMPIFQALFDKFKIKTKVLNPHKETNSTYSDEVGDKIIKALDEHKKGETIKITPETLWKI